MTNEERSIHRKLRVLQQVKRVGNARKATGILGLAGRIFINGVMHVQSMTKLD